MTLTMGRLLPVLGRMLCAAAGLGAQEPPADTLRLTLAEAEHRALERGEEIAAARALRDQADAQVTQATAGLLPQVSTALTYNRAIRTIFDGVAAPAPADTTQIPDAFDTARSPYTRYDLLSELLMDDFMSGLFSGLPFGRRNTYVASFQVSQPLFAGGRLLGARDLARHFQTAATLGVTEAEAQVTLDVREAYLDAVLARRLYEIAAESRRVAEAHLVQVGQRFEAGTASEFDVLRARVEHENRQPAVVEAENAAELALLALKRLVNLPAAQPVALVDEFAPAAVALDEAALRDVVGRRPALAAARERVAMFEAGVRIARGERLPVVALVGTLGFQAYPDHVTPPGPGDWLQDWSVTLAVSWTPFDGFRRSGRLHEAQAQLRQARLEEAQLHEGLVLGLEAALAEHRNATARLAARRETVVLAERAHELAALRYGGGLATQLEVTDAALQLDQARVHEVEALHDYARALASVERLTGVGLLRREGP